MYFLFLPLLAHSIWTDSYDNLLFECVCVCVSFKWFDSILRDLYFCSHTHFHILFFAVEFIIWQNFAGNVTNLIQIKCNKELRSTIFFQTKCTMRYDYDHPLFGPYVACTAATASATMKINKHWCLRFGNYLLWLESFSSRRTEFFFSFINKSAVNIQNACMYCLEKLERMQVIARERKCDVHSAQKTLNTQLNEHKCNKHNKAYIIQNASRWKSRSTSLAVSVLRIQ